MPYHTMFISDKEAEAFKPLPKEGTYRRVWLQDKWAVLSRQKDSRTATGWAWALALEREVEKPFQPLTTAKGQ